MFSYFNRLCFRQFEVHLLNFKTSFVRSLSILPTTILVRMISNVVSINWNCLPNFSNRRHFSRLYLKVQLIGLLQQLKVDQNYMGYLLKSFADMCYDINHILYNK